MDFGDRTPADGTNPSASNAHKIARNHTGLQADSVRSLIQGRDPDHSATWLKKGECEKR
jgi:hypothetical protein